MVGTSGSAGNGGSGEIPTELLQISYTIEDIDASAKAVKISLDMPIKDLELIFAEYYGFTTFSDCLTAMGPITQADFESMVEGQTSLPYEEGGLKNFLEMMGDVVTIEPTIGETRLSYANSEFIATRSGIYTVKATAENGREAEIQVNVTGIEEEKFSNIYETTATYTDTNGKTAKIPAGFAVGISEGINTIAEGLVITDAVDSEGYSIGNEFVWIPVESEETFVRESFGDSNWNTTNYTEPFNYNDGTTTYTGYSTEETEYNTMRTQVLAHNGFYIGRYEAGDGSIKNGLRNGTTEAHTVVSKRGVAPYNYVKWGESMSEIGTEGAVYLSQNMYKNSESVTSTLIYGVQWDAMCRYIEDYDRTGQSESKILKDLTGRIGGDNSKNIYDLAENCCEYTMEAKGSNTRIARGTTSSKNPISFRGGNGGFIDIDMAWSFRCALYVK